jgi:hypothetical protein
VPVLLFLASSKEWRMPERQGTAAMAQFATVFENCFTA